MLVFAGIIIVATVVLVVGTLAAAIGLGVSLVVMPWLMPLVWLVSRRQRKAAELSGARPGATSRIDRRGAAPFTGTGRGPIPVY
jgi:hypothetical protein